MRQKYTFEQYLEFEEEILVHLSWIKQSPMRHEITLDQWLHKYAQV